MKNRYLRTMVSSRKRKLAAIMFTDMVGFTRANQEDEDLALELLAEHQDIVRSLLSEFHGHEIKTIGDAFLVVFESAVDAANCGIAIQSRMHERNQIVPPERIIALRIAIHVDDVVETENDAYGDGVNIASRVQSIAPSGGLCFTEQAYSHLKNKVDFQIKKIGLRSLKGIKGSIGIFRAVFPWESYEQGIYLPRMITKLFQWLQPYKTILDPKLPNLYALTIAGIAIILGVIFATTINNTVQPSRHLASISLDTPAKDTERLFLNADWMFTLAAEDDTLLDWKLAQRKEWHEFNALKPWTYKNNISGRFWLRKKFSITQSFKHPALVLGLVQGNHRVYLNGQFIGGGDYYRELMYYSFDNTLLKQAPAQNEILVLVESKERLIPGVQVLPKIGSFIDEFSSARNTVWKTSTINYHLKRTIYLVLSFLFAFACFVYYLHHRRTRVYLYFTMILFAGALALLYGNSIVHASLSYPFHRFLNFQSLMFSSALLFSAFLAVSKVSYLEVANNVLMVVLTVAAAILLLFSINSPSEFAEHYQTMFSVASLYTAMWVLAATYITLVQMHQRMVRQTPGMGRLDYQIVLLVSGFLTAMINFSATWTGFSFLTITRPIQNILSEIGIGFPLVFSLGIGLLMLLEHSENAQQIEYRIKRDELVLKILRIVNREPNLLNSLAAIQELVCQFIGAKRSTLYLVEPSLDDASEQILVNEDGQVLLRAHHAIGTEEQVAAVREHVPSNKGLIGYVIRYKSPVLVRDFRLEPKFQKMLNERPSEKLYESTSCIVIPLVAQQELKGVLTVADKDGQRAFDEQDFFVLNNFSRDLSLIIQNATQSESNRQRIIDLEKKLTASRKEQIA